MSTDTGNILEPNTPTHLVAVPTHEPDPRIQSAWNDLITAYGDELTARGTSDLTRVLRLEQARRLARQHTATLPADLGQAELMPYLREPTWGPSARKDQRAALAGFFAWAHVAGMLPDNPAAALPPARLIEPRPGARLGPMTLEMRHAIQAGRRHPARTWAKLTGHPYTETGRVPRALLDAWHAAGAPVMIEPPTADEAGRAWAHLLEPFYSELIARGLRPSTIAQYQAALTNLARRCEPDPSRITRPDLIRYLSDPTWAAETRKARRVAIVAFFAWAHLEGHLATNPAERLPRVRVPAGVPSPAPETVIRDAINGARADVRLMILLGALAGLRRSEIATLHTDCLTEDGLRIVGKGGRSRMIPLHPSLADELAAFREARDLHHGYLFTPEASAEPYTVGHVGTLVSRRMPPGWTTHKLRHRFASRSYAGQYNLRAVQELLGHASPAVTARYVAVPDVAARDAVLAVPPIPGIETPDHHRHRNLPPAWKE